MSAQGLWAEHHRREIGSHTYSLKHTSTQTHTDRHGQSSPSTHRRTQAETDRHRGEPGGVQYLRDRRGPQASILAPHIPAERAPSSPRPRPRCHVALQAPFQLHAHRDPQGPSGQRWALWSADLLPRVWTAPVQASAHDELPCFLPPVRSLLSCSGALCLAT